MKTGQKIALLRKEKGWTQEDLAKVTKLSKGYIAAIEEGVRPKIKTLAIIAESLGVAIVTLFEDGTE